MNVHAGERRNASTKTPMQVALSELAAFKFNLIETVTADPKLRAAPCTEAMVVFLKFVTIDPVTLKPTSTYASTNKLLARTGMKSKNTVRQARKLLVENGYLIETGELTKDGCQRYEVQNPNFERVSMHVRECEEYFTQVDAERRRDDRLKERAKKAKSGSVVSDIDPTQAERGVFNWTHVVSGTDPNSLKGHTRNPVIEEEEQESNPCKVDALDLPLPIPEGPHEEAAAMARLCNGRPVNDVIRRKLKQMLSTGALTLRLANNLIKLQAEDAA